MNRNVVVFPLLLAVATAVGADPPPPPEYPPLVGDPAEPAARTAAGPAAPWIKHLYGSEAAASARAADHMEMSMVPPASSEELKLLRKFGPWSHLQGEGIPPDPPLLEAKWPASALAPFKESALPREAGAEVMTRAQGDRLRNFNGITNSGWIPPDTVVAVGPEHVLEATNSGFAIYSKTGRLIQPYTTMDTYFNALKPADWNTNGGFMFDPKVYYSWHHQKFVMFILGREDVNQTSHFYIAISQTSDATKGWWRWRFDWPETDSWVDYSAISADPWGLYVTGNVFFFGGGFKYAQLWTLNPAMFSGGASNGWRFWDLRWPISGDPLAFTLQAARPQSTAGGQESFFVNGSEGSYNRMCLWQLTGDRTSSPSLTRVSIDVDTYYPVNENVGQPDVVDRLDALGSRVVEAVYSNRRVWATLTSGENATPPTWGGMYTARLHVDNNTMDWSDLIWSSDNFYFYPAVTVAPGSNNPRVALFGSWASSTRYVSTIFHINNPGGDNSFISYHSGEAAYVARDSNSRNRWGDYSGVAYDWSCGTVWGAAEYARTSNRWGTRIVEADFTGTGPCPRIDVTFPTSTTTLYAGNPATLTWTRSNLTSDNQLFVYFYKNGAFAGQLGGGLSISATSATLTMPWDITTLGQMRVGSWNPTTSSWETADLSDAFFTLAAAPDLRMSYFSSPNSTVVEGQSLQLNAVVMNSGNGSSTATTLRYYRSVNSVISAADTLIGTQSIGGLGAGASTNRQLTTTNAGTPGVWHFGACADSVANDPPGNNCTASPVAVTVTAPLPDLIFADGFE